MTRQHTAEAASFGSAWVAGGLAMVMGIVYLLIITLFHYDLFQSHRQLRLGEMNVER